MIENAVIPLSDHPGLIVLNVNADRWLLTECTGMDWYVNIPKCMTFNANHVWNLNSVYSMWQHCLVWHIIAPPCFIRCNYCTPQPTCSWLCNIIYSLILCHYKHLCLLRTSYCVLKPSLNAQGNRCCHQGFPQPLRCVTHDCNSALSHGFSFCNLVYGFEFCATDSLNR